MARLNGDAPPGARGLNPRASVLNRESLFGATDTPESQTQGRQPEGDASRAHADALRRQQEIADKLLTIEEEPDFKDSLNLLEYITHKHDDLFNDDRTQITFADAAGKEVTLEVSLLKSLSPFKLRDAVKAAPEGIHNVLCNIFYDHKLALNQLGVVQEANELNQQKNKDLVAQCDRLESEMDTLSSERDAAIAEKQKLDVMINTELGKIVDDNGKSFMMELKKDREGVIERKEFYKDLAEDLQAKIDQLEAQEAEVSQGTTLELSTLRNDIADITQKNKELEEHIKQLGRRDLSPFSRNRLLADGAGVGDGGGGGGDSEDGSRRGRDRSRSAPRGRHDGSSRSPYIGRRAGDVYGPTGQLLQRGPGRRINDGDTPGAQSNASNFTQYDDRQVLAVKGGRDIRTPDKFGNDGEPAFDEWMRDVENKVSSSTFRDVNSSLAYVHSLTKLDVWQLLDPRIPSRINKRATVDPFKSLDEMLEYMTERYGQRDQANRSFHELAALKQGEKETFSAHYTKFQKCRARVHLTPESEKQLLEGSLNYRYGNRLIDGSVCHTLKELTDRLYNIEDGFARLEANKPARSDNGNNNNNRGGGNRGGGGQRGGRGGNNNSGGNINSGLLPYSELPEKFKNLKTLTDDERFKLIRSGHCLRCREPGHHGRDPACIFKKYQMPPRANTMNADGTGSGTNNGSQGNGETST